MLVRVVVRLEVRGGLLVSSFQLIMSFFLQMYREFLESKCV